MYYAKVGYSVYFFAKIIQKNNECARSDGRPALWQSRALTTFEKDLQAQGADVVQVDWKPPAGGDEKMLKLLEKLGS